MNPETIKLFVWAAMHHPAFANVQVDPPIEIYGYVADGRCGLAVTLKRWQVTIPSVICLDYVKLYGATTPELQRWHNITKLREQP